MTNHPNRSNGEYPHTVRIMFEYFSPQRGEWRRRLKWRERGQDADDTIAEMRSKPEHFRNIRVHVELPEDGTTIDLRSVPSANLIAELKIRGYRVYGQRLASLATAEPAQNTLRTFEQYRAEELP